MNIYFLPTWLAKLRKFENTYAGKYMSKKALSRMLVKAQTGIISMKDDLAKDIKSNTF